jgi:nucleotide-binding universal stress UspA family protein
VKEVNAMKYVNWILVPTNFSKDSELALEEAKQQAARRGSGVIVLHVKAPADLPQARTSIEEEAVDRMMSRKTAAPEEPLAFITCSGDPVDIILRMAAQYRPRKIIMGRGGDAFRSGSVTEAVAQKYQGIVESVSATHDDISIHAAVA